MSPHGLSMLWYVRCTPFDYKCRGCVVGLCGGLVGNTHEGDTLTQP